MTIYRKYLNGNMHNATSTTSDLIRFYSNSKSNAILYLEKGLSLWDISLIKDKIIPFLELDKLELYYLNKSDEELNAKDVRLAKQNHELLLRFNHCLVKYNTNLDIENLLMAIATERVLKGLLLSNGYLIHEHRGRNRLTHISRKPETYSGLTTDVYTLGEFANPKKFHVLRATLPDMKEIRLVIILNSLVHLKKLRDREAHLALGYSIFQIPDLILYKCIYQIMNKARTSLMELREKDGN
jgi:hypothetical protein